MPVPPSKRRKVGPGKIAPVEEISFDPNARHEFLTGFRKRKQQRAKHAQEVAERKAKEERKEQKKKAREERQAEFRKAVAEHRKRMDEVNNSGEQKSGSQNGSDTDGGSDQEEEWDGFAEAPPVDYEDEYIDEDKHTTVTVEEVDLSRVDGLTGIRKDDDGEQEEYGGREKQDNANGDRSKSKAKVRTKGEAQAPKKKKKRKFTYESKAERKATRLKEREGNRKRAKARRSKS